MEWKQRDPTAVDSEGTRVGETGREGRPCGSIRRAHREGDAE